MIRDKIFVKFAIVFGIGVLLFGSIIFFVNRNPKNEKHLNKVHKSVDAESTPVSDGPIKQTSAGFYLYDKAEQPIMNDQIIEVSSDGKYEFNLECINSCNTTLNYIIAVFVNDCYQEIEHIEGGEEKAGAFLLNPNSSEKLNIKFSAKSFNRKNNQLRMVMIYYPDNIPNDSLDQVLVGESAGVYKLKGTLPNLVNSRKRLAIVAQTTYNILVWEKCLEALPKDNPNIMVYDTICHATQVRQSDADKLSRKSDLMIIVGGRHSSNTVKLYHVCNRNCRSYHIENSDELYTLDLGNAEKIGITAGASTPAHIIKEVQQTMTEIMDNNAVEEDINFAEALDQSFKKIHTGEKVKGTVCSVNDSEAIVDVGTKHTGYVPRSELTDDASKKPSDVVAVGDVLDLIVTKINDQEGIVTLSKKKVDEMKGFEEIIKAKDEEAVLEGTVSASVKGGVIINYAGVRVFIPASQSGLPRGAEMDSLVKTTQRFVILEVNEHRRRAVGSIKAVLKAEKDAAKEAFWETAEVGKTYKGEVKSLTSYGAFVDLGGIDGMGHISELSWKRIKHPSEVVKVGDYIEVYIKDLDKENNRISLGYKKQEDNPWEKFKANYKVGDEIDATIVSITPFGAFAQIIDGVDGLIHISQLADKRVENVKDIVSVGDVVRVKIIDIDIENKRISISMRALLEENNDADYED